MESLNAWITGVYEAGPVIGGLAALGSLVAISLGAQVREMI
jgi:hypothetical protein